MTTCSHCGEELREDARFCDECGKPTTGRRWPLSIGVIGVIIAALAALAAGFSAWSACQASNAANETARIAEEQLKVNSHFGLVADMHRGDSIEPGYLSIRSTGVLSGSPLGEALVFLRVKFSKEVSGGYKLVYLPVEGFYSRKGRASCDVVQRWGEMDGAWEKLRSAVGIGTVTAGSLEDLLKTEYCDDEVDCCLRTYVVLPCRDLREREQKRFLSVDPDSYNDAGDMPDRCDKVEGCHDGLVSEGIAITPESTPEEMRDAVSQYLNKPGRIGVNELVRDAVPES